MEILEKELVYENIWTKLNLDKVRGNKIFKGIWRGARVAVVGALIALADNITYVLTGFEVIPIEYVAMIAPIVEKWLREYIKETKF